MPRYRLHGQIPTFLTPSTLGAWIPARAVVEYTPARRQQGMFTEVLWNGRTCRVLLADLFRLGQSIAGVETPGLALNVPAAYLRITAMYAPRILIVDDDEEIRQLFRRILEEVGYAVTTVSSGYRALREIGNASYEAMVVDLSLPDMEGFELMRKARYDCPHLKVLVVSGFMGGCIFALADELGADATLDKLLAPERLLAVVCKMLDECNHGGSFASFDVH